MYVRPPAGRRPPPIVNLPPATKLVAVLLILFYLAELVPGLHRTMLLWLAFEPRAAPVAWIAGAATFGLLHGSAMHLIGNLLGVVILAPLVERRHGAAALIRLLLAGAAAGAAAHTAVQYLTHGNAILIGASASVAALIGWSLRQVHDGRGFGHLNQAVTIYGLFFVGFNLVGLLALDDSPIAYAAHVGGFLAGWLLGHFGTSLIGRR